MRLTSHNGKTLEYSDAIGFGKCAIDVHKSLKNKDVRIVNKTLVVKANYSDRAPNNTFQEKLDISTWLPFASKKYDISANISDYIFVPVFTIPTDLPNRNGVAFPLAALLEFNVEAGMQAYKTFKGKPVHYEHKNDKPKEAYGVIADCSLRRLVGFGNGKVWKHMELLAIDRSKNPAYAHKVLSGEMNSYSMGAMVGRYTCSVGRCQAKLGNCNHIQAKPGTVDFKELNGELVFKNVWDVTGFETSGVATPAFHVANSNWLMMF